MSEIKLQAKCYQDTWNNYPEVRYKFFHVPNGGKRSKVEAFQLKASGVLEGVPDLFLSIARHGYHGLYIEMKDEKGVLRPGQKRVIPKLQEENYCVHVINTEEKYWTLIKWYLEGVGEEPGTMFRSQG